MAAAAYSVTWATSPSNVHSSLSDTVLKPPTSGPSSSTLPTRWRVDPRYYAVLPSLEDIDQRIVLSALTADRLSMALLPSLATALGHARQASAVLTMERSPSSSSPGTLQKVAEPVRLLDAHWINANLVP